ncbi:hypothetical protein BN2476_650045 [Paraburkholderia piptadeniae]|uniref:Flavin reductase like domain-containing protein n=1 Tax=Paraburkholderia piptadeniae TaxID=1701573 RepID=A0A1N7SN89_9BURK|nr:flavin reductase family protein [Paraburkholderia piptadeniae]SIT48775.1 hypothetical protein BN2476_650045 [Paraburkholderia piptadeniae]
MGETGLPVLANALTTFECQIGQVMETGSHNIFIANVVSPVVRQAEIGPLLYSTGASGQLALDQPRAIHELLWVSNWNLDAALDA